MISPSSAPLRKQASTTGAEISEIVKDVYTLHPCLEMVTSWNILYPELKNTGEHFCSPGDTAKETLRSEKFNF